VHARCHKQAQHKDERKRTLRAVTDTCISPGKCTYVPVDCPAFKVDQDGEWILERSLLADTDDSFGEFRKVPVMNSSTVPKMIRKGEALGVLQECGRFLDKPSTKEEAAEMSRKAESYRVIVEAMATASSKSQDRSLDDDSPSGVQSQEQVIEGESENANGGEGPKTAATDEVEMIPSEDLWSSIDVGDLPEELKEKAWTMLEKNVDAFGFDDRLGHHPAQARVRLKEGIEPISLPNYGTSPQKKIVIDKQVDKWFKSGVIEASKSPWGAPVVIAYRNGKARLCIDYRKLNAATIADKFPIPRQSEILSSLSGAQVLS
jgi:hypothetical protein